QLKTLCAKFVSWLRTKKIGHAVKRIRNCLKSRSKLETPLRTIPCNVFNSIPTTMFSNASALV
ncbi:hypothetical protein PHET_00676, partial [Paragonimus heterotremus]